MKKLDLVQVFLDKLNEERRLDRQYHQFLLGKNLKREAQFYDERIKVLDTIRFELKDIMEGTTTEADRIRLSFFRD